MHDDDTSSTAFTAANVSALVVIAVCGAIIMGVDQIVSLIERTHMLRYFGS